MIVYNFYGPILVGKIAMSINAKPCNFRCVSYSLKNRILLFIAEGKFLVENRLLRQSRISPLTTDVVFTISISNSIKGISVSQFVLLPMMMSSASENKIFFDTNHQKLLGWEVSRC